MISEEPVFRFGQIEAQPLLDLAGEKIGAGLIFCETAWRSVDRIWPVLYHPSLMNKPDLDALQQKYKRAVDQWVAAIRAEEALATPDHSETAMERWDSADFAVQDSQKQAKEARDAYKEGLRKLHYGI